VRVEGERTFAAPRDTVWRVLNDPESMAKTMPGVESFDVQDDRHWTATVKIPLGLGGLRMKINFEKTEERAPDFARLAAKGQGVGAIMNMVTSFELSESDASSTSMKWTADVSIAGPVGSMGQRVLQPIVNQQVGQVLRALEEQVDAAHSAAPAGAGAAAVAGAGAAATLDGTTASEMGDAGTPQPPPEPYTEPDVKDYGEPAQADADPEPDEGTSGADEGISPWAPEAYDTDPEGPTTSTEGSGGTA
jgi:carbon monoxide dehydrogenase subunit G